MLVGALVWPLPHRRIEVVPWIGSFFLSCYGRYQWDTKYTRGGHPLPHPWWHHDPRKGTSTAGNDRSGVHEALDRLGGRCTFPSSDTESTGIYLRFGTRHRSVVNIPETAQQRSMAPVGGVLATRASRRRAIQVHYFLHRFYFLCSRY
jgi:hypothetical protein